MTDTASLIARLEKATGADEILDIDIFEAVGRPAWDEAIHNASLECRNKSKLVRAAARFTVSYDAAAGLVPKHHSLALGDCNEDGQPWACLTDADGTDFAATGATPVIALCIAALKARSLT